MDPDPSQGERGKPAALQLELPGPARSSVRPPPHALAGAAPGVRAPRTWRGVARTLGIAGLVVVGCGALVEIVLPRYIRSTCIGQAAAHGITLAIDDASIGRGGFVLTGVKATAAALPGASVEAPEVTIATRGLHVDTLTASGMQVQLEGRWSRIASAIERWRSSASGGQGGEWAPKSVVVDGSRVVWHGPIGDSATIEASGVHLEAGWGEAANPRDLDARTDTTLHATSSQVTVAIPAGTLGPWRVDIDRDVRASRARVALDPAVPDTCDLLLVGDAQGVTSAEANIPRSPLARLGIPPALLGLKGPIQVELALRYVPFTVRAGATATAKGGLHGVPVGGVPRPLDIAWDLTAVGDRAPPAGDSQSIDVTNARIAAGPLVGNARGTLKTFNDGFRLDLSWKAGPVPCTAFDTPLGPGQPFDIGYELRQLAQNTGIAAVHGDVSASGTLAFDSRDLGATALSFVPQVHCDVALGL